MNRIVFALFIFLAACAPAVTTGSDPNLDLLVAQARLTGTAQSFAIQVVGWTATAQSWTLTPSLTPAPTSTPTISPTPTINVTGTLAVEQMNADIKEIKLETERRENSNQFWTVILPVFLLAILLIVGLVAFQWVRGRKYEVHKSDVPGDKGIVLNKVNGQAVDMDANPNYVHNNSSVAEQMFVQWLERKYGFVPKDPRNTKKRQDTVKERDQSIDYRSRSTGSRRLLAGQGLKALPDGSMYPAHDKFLLPSWDLVNGWDGKKGIPYYTASGLEFIDGNQHLSVISMTGMGKSRRFMRPYIACALAMERKVIIIGKATDYWPFENHTNAKLLKVNQMTNTHQAMRYRDILKAIVEEMERRDVKLTSLRKSTWEHAGLESTTIVLDELGNALRIMRQLNVEYARQCLAWIEALVSEGRKNGLHILLANQRATGMASILSQTGKAIFRVEPDEEKAHKSLAGASDLAEGYFLAKFGSSKLAGAFEPTDDELIKFILSRPVRTLEQDDFIDAKFTEQREIGQQEVRSLPEQRKEEPKVESRFTAEIKQMAEDIRAQWHVGLSKNKTARLLFNRPYEGGFTTKTDLVIDYLTSTTTTAQTAPESGFNPVFQG